ncbi:Uncharacterised protein [Vibrio cholerae]|nr:Uncharacterised protein [Vibrio cholerae]
MVSLGSSLFKSSLSWIPTMSSVASSERSSTICISSAGARFRSGSSTCPAIRPSCSAISCMPLCFLRNSA